jgi:hypothetical protein
MICYLEFVQKNEIRYYVLSILFFFLAFLAKEQVIVLTLCILLIDWFIKRDMKRACKTCTQDHDQDHDVNSIRPLKTRYALMKNPDL